MFNETIINEINKNDEIDKLNANAIKHFNNVDKLYYEKANIFYKNLDSETMDMIYSIITKKKRKKKISLRFLDWFITKYCKLYNITIKIDNKYNKIDKCDINSYYKAYLRSFHKSHMDPFKRTKKKEKIFKFDYTCNGYTFTTTLSQLNFIKWIIENDILPYIINNYDELFQKIDHVNKFYKKKKLNNSVKLTNSITTVDLSFKKLNSMSIEEHNELFTMRF